MEGEIGDADVEIAITALLATSATTFQLNDIWYFPIQVASVLILFVTLYRRIAIASQGDTSGLIRSYSTPLLNGLSFILGSYLLFVITKSLDYSPYSNLALFGPISIMLMLLLFLFHEYEFRDIVDNSASNMAELPRDNPVANYAGPWIAENLISKASLSGNEEDYSRNSPEKPIGSVEIVVLAIAFLFVILILFTPPFFLSRFTYTQYYPTEVTYFGMLSLYLGLFAIQNVIRVFYIEYGLLTYEVHHKRHSIFVILGAYAATFLILTL